MAELDPAIVAVLEKGDRITTVVEHGGSTWATTKRINAERPGGERRSYFLKTLGGEDAAERVYGEYQAMTEIYNTMPSIAPKPHGYGECHEKGTFFFVCDFLDIAREPPAKGVLAGDPGASNLPDAARLGKTLAELHHRSQSPTGQFGFHCTTFDGEKPLRITWDSNWTRFFTHLIDDVYQQEKRVNGLWQPLEDVMQVARDRLIPRLLDPLTVDGRTIKPCLIHGDLWESNIGTDRKTGNIYIYDACSYYAHHEKEVAIWRVEHHKMTEFIYRKEYFEQYPESEPKQEADDRGRLYAVETLLINSLSFPGAVTRRRAYEELQYLIEKYSP